MLKKGLGSKIKFQNNNDKVILFVHGFRNNPQVFEEIADIFFNKGFSYYNLRLPGHGMQNDNAILEVKLRDWENITENIFLDLSDQFNKIYLCGFSMGALLVLNLAKKYNKIEKIGIISPVFKLKYKRSHFLFLQKIFQKKINKNTFDCSIGEKLKIYY